MKVLIPISLFFFGIVAFFFPLLLLLLVKNSPPFPFDVILFFGPMALGVGMIGFGIHLAVKSYNDKGD